MTLKPGGAGRGQLPLELSLEGSTDREDLVASGSNRLALELIDHWPDWPSNTVILAGPTGSGKSHIAGVWASFAKARIVPMRRLTAMLAAEIDGNLVLEDATAGQIDEDTLFHLFNRQRAAGNHTLITSREFPSGWQIKLPDLASRLRLAHLVELEEPDDPLLAAVIVKLFSDRQIEVSASLVDYLVLRMERSLGAANRIVEWMDREALARKTKPGRKLAAEALEALGMA